MSNLTQVQTGSFTSAGTAVTLNLRAGTSWMNVWNQTAIAGAVADAGYKFEWQLGQTSAFEYQSNATPNAVFITVADPTAFIPIDTSLQVPGNPVAITGSTNAQQPVITTGSTAGLSVGSVVRLTGITAQPNLSGYDFGIDTITVNTSFRVAPTLANGPGAAGTNGFYRIIPFDPIFYPTRRLMVLITRNANAQVTTSVPHNYQVGQSVRLNVPAEFGMIQADGLIVNITAIVNAYNFTTDLNSAAFSAFTFPLVAAYPFTQAACVPVGEETDQNSNPNLLNDATVNNAIIGMILAGGINGPAGQDGDVIFWQAGRAENF